MQDSFDILICGAGLVGTSLALALAKTNLSLKIAVTEAAPLKTTHDFNADGRSLALNYMSAKILEDIAVWPLLKSYVTAIQKVHVSTRGRFGKVRFSAQEEQVPALGYVIPAPILGVGLNQALIAEKQIHLFNPAKVIALNKNAAGYAVTLQTSSEKTIVLQTRLLVAADGTQSSLRELVGITSQTQALDQMALATRIQLTHDHQNIAYERFLAEGALALLPLPANKAAVILTGKPAFINELQALDETHFLMRIQDYFGNRLGRFLQVEKRHTYPLNALYTKEQVKENFILIGNAAHTIHPIAAQGFNLGLQDVAVLAKFIKEAIQNKQDFTALQCLKLYEQQRLPAQKQIVKFTQNLISIFAYDFLPINIARSMGLKLLDLCTPLKHRLANRLMGLDSSVY